MVRHLLVLLLLLDRGHSLLVPRSVVRRSRSVGSCPSRDSSGGGARVPTLRYHRSTSLQASNAAIDGAARLGTELRRRWALAVADMKKKPWTYISIPIVAALVGYITNYVGVKMLFYPIKWRGIPLYQWENQPLGIIGWQGIVPAKRFAMATKMVDVTIARLLSVPEVFRQLDPRALARLLAPTVSRALLRGLVPSPLVRFFLRRTARDLIRYPTEDRDDETHSNRRSHPPSLPPLPLCAPVLAS